MKNGYDVTLGSHPCWRKLVEEAGINLIVLDNPILNTEGKTDLEKKLISNIVFELLSYMAEKERQKIR